MYRPAPRSLRVHLADAAAHLRFARRSLLAAADIAPTGSRKLERLASTVGALGARLDPALIERHARKAGR